MGERSTSHSRARKSVCRTPVFARRTSDPPVKNRRAETPATSQYLRKPPPAEARPVDLKLEIVVIPVSDVERAKQFYAKLGWRLDADFAGPDDYRVIQFTPPGSNASVIFGKNVTSAAPGSAQGLYLVVSDIEAARNALLGRGVAISEAFHAGGDVHIGPDEPYLFGRVRLSGADPARGSYRSYCLVQRSRRQWLAAAGSHRATARPHRRQQHLVLPRRPISPPQFRRAAAAHGEYEKRNGGKHDENWPDWYAELHRQRTARPAAGRMEQAKRSSSSAAKVAGDGSQTRELNMTTMKNLQIVAMAALVAERRSGAVWRAGAAERGHAHRPAAARSQRTRTRGHPGPRRPRPRRGVGKHTHPGEEVIYVLEGTLEYQIEDKPPVTLKAGDVLFIPAGTVHSARNPGSVTGSELATYIVEKGKPLLTLVK